MQPNVTGWEKHCRQNILWRLLSCGKKHLHHCPRTNPFPQSSRRMRRRILQGKPGKFPASFHLSPVPWMLPPSIKRSSEPHFCLPNIIYLWTPPGSFSLKLPMGYTHVRGSTISWSSDVKTILFQHSFISSSALTKTSSGSSPKAGSKGLETLRLKDCFILSSVSWWTRRNQRRSSYHKISPTSDITVWQPHHSP